VDLLGGAGQIVFMKNILNVPCNNCGEITTNLKKEIFGYFFLLFAFPYLVFFGINAASILYFMVFIGVGLYWVITKPSKKITCNECSKKTIEQT
jgi:ribosomal protein S27E